MEHFGTFWSEWRGFGSILNFLKPFWSFWEILGACELIKSLGNKLFESFEYFGYFVAFWNFIQTFWRFWNFFGIPGKTLKFL